MSQLDGKPPSPQSSSAGAPWFFLGCSLLAVVAALVPYAALLERQSPPWLALAVGLCVFPVLPLLWLGLAESRRPRPLPRFSLWTRFGLRTLAVGLVVLGVSLGDLGPTQVVHSLRDLVARLRPKPPAKPTPLPRPRAPFGLEPFIPADATLVVGLAGSGAMEQLLAAHGVDTREKLAALATCKIDLANARVLIAMRGRETHLIVVRAPGIADERDLYCLVGVMGADRLQLHANALGGKTLEVKGLLSRALTFRVFDPSTLVAVDESWQKTVDKKLFTDDLAAAQGPLVGALARVDRGAPLWAASVDETAQGSWDLAIDSREEDGTLKLQGSSTPPSGEKDRAQIAVRVPLAFAQALPETAVALGVRGVVAAIVATSAAASPAAVPSPASPPGPAAKP